MAGFVVFGAGPSGSMATCGNRAKQAAHRNRRKADQ